VTLEQGLEATDLQAQLQQTRFDLEQSQEEIAKLQSILESRTAELRRIEIALAEERRSNSIYRAREGRPLDVNLVSAIAKEVWWEHNRRTLTYKIAKAIKGLFKS
jgi:hypothetical protein